MKGEDKAMARDLRETDISNIPDGEFKATIIRILTGPEKRMGGTSGNTLSTEVRIKKE